MVLGIYGAGGLGREVLELAYDIMDAGPKKWDEIVFFADFGDTKEIYGCTVMLFEDFTAKYPPGSVEVAIALGEPFVRQAMREKLKALEYNLAVLLHPAARVSRWASIGEGCIVCFGANISCGTYLGKNIYFQPSSSAGHDTHIGDDCVISSCARVAGSVKIGEQSYIGLQSAVREKIVIGSGVIVGMGSCVQKDIPDGMIAMGNPARPIQKNENRKVF